MPQSYQNMRDDDLQSVSISIQSFGVYLIFPVCYDRNKRLLWSITKKPNKNEWKRGQGDVTDFRFERVQIVGTRKGRERQDVQEVASSWDACGITFLN